MQSRNNHVLHFCDDEALLLLPHWWVGILGNNRIT